jgi:hypothetical protein
VLAAQVPAKFELQGRIEFSAGADRSYGMLVSGRSAAAWKRTLGDDAVRAEEASQGNAHKTVRRGSTHRVRLGPGWRADQFRDATPYGSDYPAAACHTTKTADPGESISDHSGQCNRGSDL